ncbi:HAD-like protein [Obba rivulosa]|uniref:HAD-like protein n=1 Tax=Obba rivulosa TaxID=1052685 RepID=A0A8E2AR04_9APHY|nr:HAD-like protein [Obba rivulosa]
MSSSTEPKLTQYKALLFDVYGTLIDWETGIYEALTPLLMRGSAAGESLTSKEAALRAYASVEENLQARFPTMRYSQVLERVHVELEARLKNTGTSEQVNRAEAGEGALAHTISSAATETGKPEIGTSAAAEGQEDRDDEHKAFARSIGAWRPFPDTRAALAELSRHFKLAVLSNIDRDSFAKTRAVLEGAPGDPHHFTFDAVYTAEDASAYKPQPEALAYALRHLKDELGIAKEQVLVTANSVFHDIIPARKAGVAGVWIERPGSLMGLDGGGEGRRGRHFDTLGNMAEAVKREASE